MPIADTKQEIDEKVWNEEAVKEAWTEGARSPAHGAIVYGASKAESEKALWKWVEETKPEMTVNCGRSLLISAVALADMWHQFCRLSTLARPCR